LDAGQTNAISYLDSIRIDEGRDRCAAAFKEAVRKNGLKAAALINDRRLSFLCLYTLWPQISQLRLYSCLNSRNLTALRIIGQMRKPQAAYDREDGLTRKRNRVYTVLKWMLETGLPEDGMDDAYEQIMELTVSVLLDTYKDKSILPIVTNLIFQRSSRGHYIHDLVWALFQTEDPEALQLIAEHLKSSDPKEAELAKQLLNLDKNGNGAGAEGKVPEYETYMQWLKENDPFLFFTHEGFQYASTPVFSTVDQERKYLNKGIPSYARQPLVPADEKESAALAAFRPLNDKEKEVLSEISLKKHSMDASKWEEWIAKPISEQLKNSEKG
jgi:hypothetical protein